MAKKIRKPGRMKKYAGNIPEGVMKSIFFDEDDISIIIDGRVSAKRKAKDYLTQEDFRFLDNEAYDFFTGMQDLHPRLRKYFDYNGLNLLDFVEEELCFKSFIHHTIKDIVRQIGIVMKIVDSEEPFKVVVGDNASLKNRITLLTAGKMGMKTEIRSYNLPGRIKGFFREDLLSFGYEKYIAMQKFSRRLAGKTRQNREGILLLPYYANHADVMNSVIKLLAAKKENFDVVCVDNVFNVTKKRLKKYGIKYETFESYSNSKVRGIVRVHKKEFRKRWKQLKNDVVVKNSLFYRRIPLWELLEPRLRFMFLRRFAQVSEYIEATRHLVSVKKPSVIVVANDTSTYGRAACAVASLENVPSLLIQHGAIADEPKYSRIFADKMAVEGPEVKKSFVSKGLPQEKFFVTGQPRYDVLAKKEGMLSREEMYRKLGIGKKKKIIVLATQVPECDEKVVRAVYNAVKDMNDCVLVVKLHPAERTDAMYQRVRKETGIKNILIGKDINLYGLLNASELMMTVFSTTALEAMMLDKPVITINLTGEPDLMPYAKSGAALGVYDGKDLKDAIEKILNNKKTQQRLKKAREKFVYGMVYKMDGKASERVVGLIKSMKKTRKA